MQTIYEDKNILAINKPAGLIVHETHSIKHGTLTDWLIEHYPEIKNVGEDSARPGIVHRLDKDTSGVMIIAKNQKAFEFLKKQFAERKIKKTYLALVEGSVKQKTGKIETPVKKFSKSREAMTEYKIIKKFEKYTLLEVSPKTGRTHQIRLHLKSIGHPVVCEGLYTRKPRCPFGLQRHFLHAQALEFNLPDNSKIKLEADLPEDLEKVLQCLEEYAKN